MAFTAINDPPTASSTAPVRQPNSADSHAAGSRTVASDYLGRGRSQPTIVPVSVTSSSKVVAQGKKRSAVAGQLSKAKKQRKSSNVHNTLRVTKAQSSTDPLMLDAASAASIKAAKPKRKTAAANRSTSDNVGAAAGEPSPSAPNSISVFAPPTSMDTLEASSVRTSVECLRANAGQSCTVYQQPSSNISQSSVTSFPQPRRSGTSYPQVKITNKSPTILSSACGSRQSSSGVLGKREPSKHMSSVSTAFAAGHSDTTIGCSGRSKDALQYSLRGSPVSIAGIEVDRGEAMLSSMSAAPRRTKSSEILEADDGFGRIDDEDLLESAMSVDDATVKIPGTPPPRGRKQNMRDVDEHEDYGGALLTHADVKLREQIQTKHDINKPIVRKPFPSAIQDRSPVFGASNTALLRTCFRLGEALNAGSQAARSKRDVVLELYARVTSSWRDPKPGRKQHFVFKDLYHDNPLHLAGTFELWDQAQLWDLDSCPFLKATQRGMIARVIARMRRDGVNWRLEILSVYEATWDDINFVAGICSSHVHEGAGEDVDA